MEETSKTANKKPVRYALLTVLAVIMVLVTLTILVCYQAMKAEAYARYMGIKNVSAQNIARTIRGVEMNAKNVFEEVAKHVDTPEDVIEALSSKTNYNLDVKGYFAAFEPNFFPEKGTWFEPYVYQSDNKEFEFRQVGSARHNYFKSLWYIKAKTTHATFWSDPYYYYDGTSISGHYCTYVKPIYDSRDQLICVCGADMNFEWMSKELEWGDEASRKNNLLNKYHSISDFRYYTVLFDKDGICVSHPKDKAVTITDKEMSRNLTNKKSGVTTMDVDGESCTIYYGPIDYVDWSLAVIVPQQDLLNSLLPMFALLLCVSAIGLVCIYFMLRRIK